MAPAYPHGWLDNNGKNNWEYWKTYIQDKNNAIWEATLNVANTADGERVLYDIGPIKRAGAVRKVGHFPSTTSIAPPTQNVNTQHSLSEPGKPLAPMGNWNIRGEDVMLGPVREDAKASKAPFSAPIREDVKAKGTVPTAVNGTPLGPLPGQDAGTVAEQPAGNPVAEAGEKLATKPVTEKIKEQIENSSKELENIRIMRQAAADDYRDQISKALMDYESRKNKNTKAANDVLRRIERLKRLKADVDASYESRIAKIENHLEKLQSPKYARAEQRKVKQNTFRQQIRDLIGDTSTWVDKKIGIQYQTNTLKRNLRDIVRDATGKSDIARADRIYDYLQGTYNHNEAELKKESASIKETFQDMKITRGIQ